jgi:hypothetical protein
MAPMREWAGSGLNPASSLSELRRTASRRPKSTRGVEKKKKATVRSASDGTARRCTTNIDPCGSRMLGKVADGHLAPVEVAPA